MYVKKSVFFICLLRAKQEACKYEITTRTVNFAERFRAGGTASFALSKSRKTALGQIKHTRGFVYELRV